MLNVQSKKQYSNIYDIVMAILALLVVIILIIESILRISESTLKIINIIDTTIWLIFVADYSIRLILSENRKVFFKSNIIDLISIIPFNSLFKTVRLLRVTRFMRFTKFLKITKFIRVAVLLERINKNLNSFIKTNNFNYVLNLTIITVILGAVGMYFTENKSFTDCLWWSFVTATTVGYGDISPATPVGRIIASILMIVGIGFIGMLTGTIATFFINRKTVANYKSEVIEGIKDRLSDFENLTIDDLNDIHRVLKSLKENDTV